MPEDQYANSILNKPENDAVTYDGKKMSPKRMIEIWTSAAEAMKPFHDEVKRAEGIRRGTLVRKIAKSWADKHPEAAEAAVVRIPQRRTLESDLKARCAVVEPTYIRNAIGDLERDRRHAQAYQDYLNEWRTSEYGSPYPAYLDLGVEVGGYLRTRLPAMADMEGRPDFFERLSERAYEKKSDDEKKSYKKDGKRKRKPYVKVDDDGNPVPDEKYRKTIDTESDEDKKLSPMRRADKKKQRTEKAEEEHKRALQKYLLGRPASTGQVYGGLDVAPIFKRGIGREQAVLAAAMTRQLVTVEEAIGAGYGWKGMGGRLLVPKGDDESNTVGRNGCYYLYQFFYCQTDDEGIERPLVLYCLGGKGTSVDGEDPGRDDAVGIIDLYEEYGIEGACWSWHWGLKTRDRNPAYRGRPYLADVADTILAVEAEAMAIRAATQVNAFTGHVENLGKTLASAQGDAALEAATEAGAAGNSRKLKPFVIPKPGEATVSMGEVEPFQQAEVGRDAYQILASDMQALAEAIAVDQAASAPGSSGRAIVVGETLAKVAKKDIRDDALEAVRQDGEDHTKILAAIEKKFDIRWPILKVEQPPSDSPESTEKYTIAEFDPDWIGDGCFTRLKAEYPDELNLSALDEEAALAERGFSHFENVMKKKGITDPMAEYQKIMEWKLRFSPLVEQKVMMGVAKRRGDAMLVDILKQLQAEGEMTEAGVPGAQNGVPTAALRRAGEGANDQRGGPTAVQSAKGGEFAADMQTASLNQEATAQMQVAGAA